jgi:hypothetical protein
MTATTYHKSGTILEWTNLNPNFCEKLIQHTLKSGLLFGYTAPHYQGYQDFPTKLPGIKKKLCACISVVHETHNYDNEEYVETIINWTAETMNENNTNKKQTNDTPIIADL